MFFSERPPEVLDQWEGLTNILSRPGELPELPDASTWTQMGPAERETFNNRRLDYLGADLVISTPQLKSVVRKAQLAVLQNRSRVAGRLGVLVSGESTMGKTTACLAAMKTIYGRYALQYPQFMELDHKPVIYIEVPAGCTGKAVVGRFAQFLGLPIRSRDTLESLLTTVVGQLQKSRTVLVVVDEIHNLSTVNNGNGESVDVLKSLSNRVPATFLYAGINIHLGPLLTGDRGQQIRGRFTAEVLHRYMRATTTEKALWKRIIESFEERLLLFSHHEGDLAADEQYLHDRTRGSIGSLGRLLTGAAQWLISSDAEADEETITREVLESIPLDIDASENWLQSDLSHMDNGK